MSLHTLAQAQNGRSEALQLQDSKIKAGLIYNFLKFTSWNSSNMPVNGTLHVCLLGDDPLNELLKPLNGRTAQQFSINVIDISSAADASNCQMVYISQNSGSNISALAKQLNQKKILTIGDIDGFTTQGGMVELSLQSDDRIHIFINQAALDEAGLQIEQRLSKLADKRP